MRNVLSAAMNTRIALHSAGTLASALLIRLAFPPFDLGWLMLGAWVPLLWVAQRVRWPVAAAHGALHGFVLGVAAHHWVVPALIEHGELPSWQALTALLAIALTCAMRSALVSAAVALSAARSLPLWLAFPISVSCAELLLPGLFPWTNALAVHAFPVWGQAAAWGGATLVSVWLSLTNGLIAQAVVRAHAARRVGAAAVSLACAAVVVACASGFGAWALSQQAKRAQAAPKLRVVLAHAASPFRRQTDLVPALRAMTLAHQARAGQSDLVIWPEGVSPLPISPSDAAGAARRYWLRDRSQPLGSPTIQSPLLLGVSLDDAPGCETARCSSAAVGSLPVSTVSATWYRLAKEAYCRLVQALSGRV